MGCPHQSHATHGRGYHSPSGLWTPTRVSRAAESVSVVCLVNKSAANARVSTRACTGESFRFHWVVRRKQTANSRPDPATPAPNGVFLASNTPTLQPWAFNQGHGSCTDGSLQLQRGGFRGGRVSSPSPRSWLSQR